MLIEAFAELVEDSRRGHTRFHAGKPPSRPASAPNPTPKDWEPYWVTRTAQPLTSRPQGGRWRRNGIRPLPGCLSVPMKMA